MEYIAHMIDKDGNVVIDAIWNNNTYGAVIAPHVIGGISFIPNSSINTKGLDNPEEMKEKIISYITTHRGKNNEAPIVVEENK